MQEPARGEFRTTRWSVVLAAGARDPGEDGRAALEDLCAAYWFPLYAWARRRGADHAAAEDLVQGLFERLVARRDLAGLDPARGRFRAWLKAALAHHWSHERERAAAAKRGGDRRRVPLDGDEAERRYARGGGQGLGPDELFDRAWALALLERALARVRERYDRRGQGALFEALRGFLTVEGAPAGRRELAEGLGLTEGALKVAVHRLRQRYREAIEATVAETLDGEAPAGAEAVQAELASLFQALGRG